MPDLVSLWRYIHAASNLVKSWISAQKGMRRMNEEIRGRLKGVVSWLQNEFPAGSVEVHDDPHSETILLQVWSRKETGPPSGVDCSYEVMEDNSLDVIVEDWRSQGLIQRLTTMRGFRFPYRSDRRVLDYEVREVRCEGRLYRVTRRTNLVVEAFTSEGDRLRNLPDPNSRILAGSIWTRSAEDLCRDVQRWRGQDQ
jgi:hypothetical protein